MKVSGCSHAADGRAGIDAALVKRLISAQFPQWSDLEIVPVAMDGWDNRTYRLGDRMTVRLPTAEGYVSAVAKENLWLPRLAPQLPVPIPEVLAEGAPGEGYPFPWSIRSWLDGDPARRECIGDGAGFARALAEFLTALEAIDPAGGPSAGAHSWYRGAPLTHYDGETRRCIAALSDRIDGSRVQAAWEDALSATWSGTPVWFHGDVAAGNLLVRDGRLAAVIDFGTCGVGDPACDLVIAWTFFSRQGRAAFRRSVGHDDATWARARGWALWKALVSLAANPPDTGASVRSNLHLIDELLSHPLAGG